MSEWMNDKYHLQMPMINGFLTDRMNVSSNSTSQVLCCKLWNQLTGWRRNIINQKYVRWHIESLWGLAKQDWGSASRKNMWKKSSVKTLLMLLLPQPVTVKARKLTTLHPQLSHKDATSGSRTWPLILPSPEPLHCLLQPKDGLIQICILFLTQVHLTGET